MGVRRNLAIGIGSNVWTALVSFAVVPFYLHYLGLEAFGLIGFYTALQGLFLILDLGLTPTMTREVARCKATGDVTEARNLLHTLAIINWGVAAAIAGLMALLAYFVADHWLRDNGLPPEAIGQSVALMGVVIACRWPLGIYSGALMGAERLAQFGMISIVMVTFANVGAVAVLAFVKPSIQYFFIWQAMAGLLQVLVMRAAAWRALWLAERTRFDGAGLKRIWRFTAWMGIATLLGVVFMQSDKIVLSRLVTLEELGQYTLAGLVGRLLYLFITPTFNVIYPRLTALHAAGDEEGVVRFYRGGTRMLLAVIFPLAAYLGVFAEDLVSIWTGVPEIGRHIAPVVQLVLLGTAMNGVMNFPYALQLAYGRSHLAALISSILLVGFIPMLAVLAVRYGITGGAGAWAILNLTYVGLGTWLTHRAVLKSPGPWTWLGTDVGIPLAVSVAIVIGGGLLVRDIGLGLWSALVLGGMLALLAFVVTVVLSPQIVRALRDSWPQADVETVDPNIAA
jgi:O-antigen/teichoic acid export membrane protein